MLKKLVKALVPKVLTKGVVGVDAKDISEGPRAGVVVVTEDIDEDSVGVDVEDVGEAPLAVGIKG